jgi:proline iminopeptidase
VLVAPADVLVMPQQGWDLFDDIEKRLPPPIKSEYAGFLKRYLDYGNIFSKSETELVRLNAEFDRYYIAAAKAKGFAMPPGGDANSGGGWMVHAMYVSMGRRHDYRVALKNINAPTLVIHGADDLQPEQASRTYADLIPSAKLAVLPNAGHFLFADQPQAFAATVGQFLSDAR